MLYSEFITYLRNKVGDKRERVHVDWLGDGSTNVFQMPEDTFPILDESSTYTVKVAGGAQTETTHYTLDKDTGTITFVSTPTLNQAVTIDAIRVYLKNEDWFLVIIGIIRSLGDDFFKEFTDTTLSSTAGMTSLSLATAQPLCIAVYELFYQDGGDYQSMGNIANWRYERENNILFFGSSGNMSVWPLKFRGLRTYTIPTAISETIDVQDRFLTIIEAKACAKFYEWRYKDVIETITKETTENTRTQLQEFMMLVDRYNRDFENEKARLKPQKPAYAVPIFLQGRGRP